MAWSKHLRKPRKPAQCELCQRAIGALTEHHLHPKSRHKDKRLLKQFSRDHLRLSIAWLCGPCHKHIHRKISERELAYEYFDVERLRAHPEVSEFVEWLAGKPADFVPKTSRRGRR